MRFLLVLTFLILILFFLHYYLCYLFIYLLFCHHENDVIIFLQSVTEEVLKRFYSAMKLHVVWCKQGVWEASMQLGCERGELQQLLNSTTAFASCVTHYCAVSLSFEFFFITLCIH